MDIHVWKAFLLESFLFHHVFHDIVLVDGGGVLVFFGLIVVVS